jgi:hypothetical protein
MTTPDDHSSAPRAAYQGDATLLTLLADHGVAMAIAEVRARLAGVAAAALDRSDDGWIDLIAPKASPALAAQLTALRAEVAPPELFVGTCAERLAAVRAQMAALGLDGFLVPRADAHQGEYVPQRACRLAWLTGFTGSAGLAAVLKTKAAIFVDGRYTLQVRDQVDVALFDPQSLGEPGQSEWIADNAPQGGRIGFDPWLHTPDQVEKMAATLRRKDVTLVALDANLVDLAWSDQPPEPIGPVRVHAASLAGKESTEKRAEIAAEIKRQGAGARQPGKFGLRRADDRIRRGVGELRARPRAAGRQSGQPGRVLQARGRRRHGDPRGRSLRLAEGGEESCGVGGQPHRPSARRRRRQPLPRLARCDAARLPHRVGRLGPA